MLSAWLIMYTNNRLMISYVVYPHSTSKEFSNKYLDFYKQ